MTPGPPHQPGHQGLRRHAAGYRLCGARTARSSSSTSSPGRLMIGRRYNEGLHQAIEAKEGVKIAAESKTLATITFQNYFRMYKKLAGMTGTAKTEADRVHRDLQAWTSSQMPTNRPDDPQGLPGRRVQDRQRQVQGGHRADRWSAIRRASRCWWAPSPSRSSELLSKMLQRYAAALLTTC